MAVVLEKNQWTRNEGTIEFQRLVLPIVDKRIFVKQGNIIAEKIGFGVSVESQIEYQRNNSVPYAIPWIITFCVNGLFSCTSRMFISFLRICYLFLIPLEEVVDALQEDTHTYRYGIYLILIYICYSLLFSIYVQDLSKFTLSYFLDETFKLDSNSSQLVSLLTTYFSYLPIPLLEKEFETNYRVGLLNDFSDLVQNLDNAAQLLLEENKV
jgi:hypothetical protein